MRYCTKCGYQLVDTAKFCNYCGAPVITPAEAQVVNPDEGFSQNPYTEAAQTYQQPQYNEYQYTQPKSDEELQAEEQNFLNLIYRGLSHEAMAWRIGAIAYLIYSVMFILLGISGMFDTKDSIMDIAKGILYIPISIIGFVMASKVNKLKNILYTDCKAAFRHYTPGSIVMGALFNSIAMIFIIVYFVQTKSHAAVIERIKTKQEEYNSQR